MARNLIIRILLAVALFSIIGITAVQAYQTADSFQNPLDSYTASDYRFGQYLWKGTWNGQSVDLYHAGEDLFASTYAPVRAIANGKVVWSEKDMQGYAQVVVIEHTLPGGSKIASVYGHLSKRSEYPLALKGREVAKGEIIGYLGDTSENGGGGVHVHFEIRKGADVSGIWRYYGRVPFSELAKFNKPSDYLILIRVAGASDVYKLLSDGKKVKVFSANVFNSYGWNWADIRPVSSVELNSHANAYPTILGFKDGTFIKINSASYPEISIISSNYRYPFGSWDAYLRYGGKSDQSNVLKVTYNEYYNLHQKANTLY